MYIKETITLGSTTIQFTQTNTQQYLSFHVAKQTIFEGTFTLDLADSTSKNLLSNICHAFQSQDLSQLALRSSGEQPNLEFLSLNPLGQTLLVAYLAAVPEAINQEIVSETGLTPVLILAQSPSGIDTLVAYYPAILEALTHKTLSLHHQGTSIENKLLQYLATNRFNENNEQPCKLLEDTLQRCRKEKYKESHDSTTQLLIAAFDNIHKQFPPQTPNKKHKSDRSNNLTDDLSPENEEKPEAVKRNRF